MYYSTAPSVIHEYSPDEVKAIEKIEAFLEKYPLAEFGPGHIILSDYNLRESDFAYVFRAIEETLSRTSDIYTNADRDTVFETQKFIVELEKMMYPKDTEENNV